MRRFREALLALTVVAMLLASAGSAGAAPVSQSTIDQLIALNPGVSRAEMAKAIEAAARQSGLSTDQVAKQALTEARAKMTGPDSGKKSAASSGSSGAGKQVKVGCDMRGNILYSYASTLGYAHGHNAMYVDAKGCRVVQALGGTTKVALYADSSKVNTHTNDRARVLSPLFVSERDRIKAENHAKSKIGKPYNKNFAFNRTVDADSYNCSQLVWAAWMHAKNLDLDKDGGPGVYPVDIRDSKRVFFVRYL